MTIWMKRYWFSLALSLNSLGLWIGNEDVKISLLIANGVILFVYFIMIFVFPFIRILIERKNKPPRLFYKVYKELASEFQTFTMLPLFKFITFFYEYLYARGFYRMYDDTVPGTVIDAQSIYKDQTIFSDKVTSRPITFYHYVASIFFRKKTLDVRVHRIHLLHETSLRFHPFVGVMEAYIHPHTYKKKAFNPRRITFCLTEAQIEELKILSREAIEKDSNLYLRIQLHCPSLWRRLVKYMKLNIAYQYHYMNSEDMHFESHSQIHSFVRDHLAQVCFERILYPVYLPNKEFQFFSYNKKVNAFRGRREVKPPRIRL